MSDKKWYVVHTHSGCEQKAKLSLEERVRSLGLSEMIEEVLVPSEQVVEVVNGEKKTSSRKIFPGYILVKMNLNESTWHVVKKTAKVTGFVGKGNTPPSITEEEVRAITTKVVQGETHLKPKIVFEKGANVRVVDGPFANFNGVVDEVRPEKGKLRVLVSIFGRSTPVELDFVQVERN